MGTFEFDCNLAVIALIPFNSGSWLFKKHLLCVSIKMCLFCCFSGTYRWFLKVMLKYNYLHFLRSCLDIQNWMWNAWYESQLPVRMWNSTKDNFANQKSSRLLLGNCAISFFGISFLEKEQVFFFINWYINIFASSSGPHFLSENKLVSDSTRE